MTPRHDIGSTLPLRSIDWRIGVCLSVALSLGVLGGCSSSDDGPSDTPPSDDPPIGSTTGDGEGGGAGESDGDEPVIVDGDSTGGEADADIDGDDRPGLVIEGLNGQSPDDVVSPWFVNLSLFRRDSRVPDLGDATVQLLQYPGDFAVRNHVEFFTPALDTCEIRRGGASTGEGEGDGEGSGPPPLISGGESVTINAPSGPWFTIARRPIDGGEFIYEVDDELPGALPAGATLSIPGDVFPTVAAFPLREPGVPVRLLPDSANGFSADAEYSWLPGDGNDLINLDFLAYDTVSGDFIDFPVVCDVVDDGRFELPADAIAALAGLGDDIVLRYNRVASRIDLRDGIVFRTRIVVAE